MIPERFYERAASLFSADEYERFIKALEAPAVRALRANSIKIPAADFEGNSAFPLSPLNFCGGYAFSEEKIGADPLHHAGAYYVQDPSAMCAVAAAEEYIKPDFAVLDMCAAPGGKSTQAASLLGENGWLVSNEIDFKRSRVLRQNTERMGHRRTVVTSAEPAKIAVDFPRCFDFVITDAPCSGEGMLRKYEEAASEWSEENVLMCARRQQEILDQAECCVAPDGYLMYSTCTFSLEENEMIVDAFLTCHREYSVVSVLDAVKKATSDGICFDGCRNDMSECRRFYPHISPGEGQFICIMKRDASGDRGTFAGKSAAVPLSWADAKIVSDFLHTVMSDGTDNIEITALRDTVMISNGLPCPDYALCCGVAAGQITKGRMEPHHHLFSAYGNNFKVCAELNSDEIKAYLRGETVDRRDGWSENGWCAVTYLGCAVGGGKIVGNTLKNHYPKGLRIRK